jgi:hypothetical protein
MIILQFWYVEYEWNNIYSWSKIERDRPKKILVLSQEHYIKKVFKKFHMQDCKSIYTSIVKDECLSLRMCSKTLDEKA